ncbi:peptidase [Xylaria longipes]|nr:peptidase [Xylaria longipes]
MDIIQQGALRPPWVDCVEGDLKPQPRDHPITLPANVIAGPHDTKPIANESIALPITATPKRRRRASECSISSQTPIPTIVFRHGPSSKMESLKALFVKPDPNAQIRKCNQLIRSNLRKLDRDIAAVRQVEQKTKNLIMAADKRGGAGRGVEKVFTDAEHTKHGAETAFGGMIRQAAPHVSSFGALRPHTNSLRAIKSPAEIANMRHAGRESGRALTAAMRRSWASEKELAAFLEYSYQKSGLDGQAYIPVVAGGPRGTLIHYVLNNAPLKSDELVLVDAGGEYGTYITDITRTWPASGKFSPAQRDLYTAVLKAQRSSVSLCRASANLTLDQLHSITERSLRQELTQLGFDLGGNAMDTLFPHHVGHYIGLDVHDVPGYPRNMVLKEGHCITIEPGVYVPDDERFPQHFRGLGVRIEDSIAVGDDNPLILTTEAVKEVEDIEALRD